MAASELLVTVLRKCAFPGLSFLYHYIHFRPSREPSICFPSDSYTASMIIILYQNPHVVPYGGGNHSISDHNAYEVLLDNPILSAPEQLTLSHRSFW